MMKRAGTTLRVLAAATVILTTIVAALYFVGGGAFKADDPSEAASNAFPDETSHRRADPLASPRTDDTDDPADGLDSQVTLQLGPDAANPDASSVGISSPAVRAVEGMEGVSLNHTSLLTEAPLAAGARPFLTSSRLIDSNDPPPNMDTDHAKPGETASFKDHLHP